MQRGEVWWADIPHPIGRRPVVLLSREQSYALRGYCTVAPVTTRIRRIPTEVELGAEDGMPRPCAANLDSMTTIGTDQLDRLITLLSPVKLAAVDEAIHVALGLGF